MLHWPQCVPPNTVYQIKILPLYMYILYIATAFYGLSPPPGGTGGFQNIHKVNCNWIEFLKVIHNRHWLHNQMTQNISDFEHYQKYLFDTLLKTMKIRSLYISFLMSNIPFNFGSNSTIDLYSKYNKVLAWIIKFKSYLTSCMMFWLFAYISCHWQCLIGKYKIPEPILDPFWVQLLHPIYCPEFWKDFH